VTDHFAADAILRDIATFTELGDHRTGWPADNAVSDWLVAELRAAGVAAEHAPFSFPFVRPEPSWIDVDGKRVEGAPLYDGGTTGPAGAGAPLTDDPARANGAILVLRNPPVAAHGKGDPWGAARPAGAVLVTGDPEGAVFHRNAERIDTPFEVPILQVAQRDAGPIEAALAAGHPGRLVVLVRREPGTATNVVAILPATGSSSSADSGADPADAPIVVMTPKSGWGPCAAERGGGIVIELALARHLAALPERRREVRFLFTSGHELAHYGLTALLRERPTLAKDVALWVHLGASIGAKVPLPSRVFASDEGARAALIAAFEAEQARPFESRPPGTTPGGEAREVADRPYLSLASQHAYFHSENDTVEKAADAESVARFGRAYRRFVEPLVSGTQR
jgi:hypothetical protein